MPTKCNKVKNPCKICLETVSNKNGLQCQGACKKWVHFSCLHYTPGKIRDIKKGIIKVTCPCPDCKTTAPKEYRTDEPFSCTNLLCPSNLPRSCISTSCPSNQIDGCKPPLLVCEKTACKDNKENPYKKATYVPPSSSPSSGSSGCCAKQSPHIKGDMGNSCPDSNTGDALEVMKQICTTVGQLSNQINSLMNEMKTLNGQRGGTAKKEKPRDSCLQPQAKKPKSCNCPDNPDC